MFFHMSSFPFPHQHLHDDDDDFEPDSDEDIRDAVVDGDIQEVRRLVRDDPEVVHLVDRNGFTALHCGPPKRISKRRIVSYLLRHRADINAPGRYGLTCLIMASDLGYLSMVNLLLEASADPTIPTNNGRTALIV